MHTESVQRDDSGRYEIQLLEPRRWELRSGGKRPSVHSTASAARSAADRLERLSRLRRSLMRNGLVLVAVLAAATVVAGMRTSANPEHEAAVAYTGRMEAAFRSVVAAESNLDDFEVESDGFAGAEVAGPPVFRIESGAEDELRVSAERVSLLTGDHEGTCFTLRWTEPEWPVTGILRRGFPCEATSTTALSSSHARAASSTIAGLVNWDPLLPPERVQVGWFFPTMFALTAVALWSGVGVTLALLKARVERGAVLTWPREDHVSVPERD